MAGASPTPYASASLYVGDLASDVTEALLFENFNAVGPVASVRVCRDAATRRSLGYAYVNFHRVEDAERALDTKNFSPIRQRPCRIMWSHRDPSLRKSGQGNIFVKNLAPAIDNKTLYDTFSMFGNILSCKVATKANGESLKYGFVHYEGPESATQAIARVDNKVIAGEKVTVSQFKSRLERGGNGKFKFTNVYVKNIPENYDKNAFIEMFSPHGEITSCMLAVDKDNRPRGFGFVNFSTPEQAQSACEAMNGMDMGDNKKLFVVRAQKKEEREKELRERFEQFKVERQRKFASVNLYVKNLSDVIDTDKLREEFAKFGQITSACVMKDPQTNKSRGFGFVCFSSQEEATKAVTIMNNFMLDNKPLYVALAQRKETRRQQLEQAYANRNKVGVNGPMGHHQMFAGQPGPGPQAPMGYYPGVRQPTFYQPQMMARPWNPAQGAPGAMMGPPQLGVNYQLMAINQRGAGGSRGGGRGRGQGGSGRGGGKGQQGAGASGPYKYGDNVRNQRDPQPRPPQQAAPIDQSGQVSDRLTHTALAEAPDEARKQMIGERLFPLIKAMQPTNAGKITGMLLEMDNTELLHLLENNGALKEKVEEATQVLNEYELQQRNAEAQ